jgi:murein L,D-transpeptidase YafK
VSSGKRRLALVILGVAALSSLLFSSEDRSGAQAKGDPQLRVATRQSADYKLPGSARAKRAYEGKLEVVKGLFKGAKVSFPPAQLLLRAFKKEKVLEVWASSHESDPLSRVAIYEICSASGDLGPKKKSGDWQVPEGFYTIDLYKNQSDYYLALRVSYPNRRDRVLGYTGSAIMIHGNCVSIGCLAMSDERIQELWVMATSVRDRRGTVVVHLFPSSDWSALLAMTKDVALKAFWSNLKEGYDLFERTRKLARVSSDSKGRYLFQASPSP